MTLLLVFDDGARFTESFCGRSTPDLRAALEAAADAEGISQAEFARRAIAERIARTTEPGGSPRRGDAVRRAAKLHRRLPGR